jgi:hypothetical protein
MAKGTFDFSASGYASKPAKHASAVYPKRFSNSNWMAIH